MAWTTRGLRGSALENFINITNDVYRKKGLAIIQKIPTSIVPVEFNNETKTISLAYFEQKSTVDYIGVVQGLAVCFDAKETAGKSLPLQNIHQHQMEFMSDFEKQQGLSFLLINFTVYGEYYFMPYESLKTYYEKSLVAGGRKSIPYSAFDKKYLINDRKGGILNYLEPISNYISEKSS